MRNDPPQRMYRRYMVLSPQLLDGYIQYCIARSASLSPSSSIVYLLSHERVRVRPLARLAKEPLSINSTHEKPLHDKTGQDRQGQEGDDGDLTNSSP
jgi:hypothetical protein